MSSHARNYVAIMRADQRRRLAVLGNDHRDASPVGDPSERRQADYLFAPAKSRDVRVVTRRQDTTDMMTPPEDSSVDLESVETSPCAKKITLSSTRRLHNLRHVDEIRSHMR